MKKQLFSIFFLLMVCAGAVFAQKKTAANTAQSIIEKYASGIVADLQLNHDNLLYTDGDELRITLSADTDSYFKLYHIDVDGNLSLIFPNSADTDNTLTAGKTRTLPAKSKFVLGAPYGEEVIFAVVSNEQFADIGEAMQRVAAVQATEKSIKAAVATKGLTIHAADAPPAKFGAAWVPFTITAKNLAQDEFSYTPHDITDAVLSMRTSVTKAGGTFSGDDECGVFFQKGFSGSYIVTNGELSISIRHEKDESILVPVNATGSKGVSGFNFSFTPPENLSQVVQNVKSAIGKHGGKFNGNESEGAFTASGISGKYAVDNAVTVTITEKPFIISDKTIEKEVKNFFGAK